MSEASRSSLGICNRVQDAGTLVIISSDESSNADNAAVCRETSNTASVGAPRYASEEVASADEHHTIEKDGISNRSYNRKEPVISHGGSDRSTIQVIDLLCKRVERCEETPRLILWYLGVEDTLQVCSKKQGRLKPNLPSWTETVHKVTPTTMSSLRLEKIQSRNLSLQSVNTKRKMNGKTSYSSHREHSSMQMTGPFVGYEICPP